MWLTDTVGELEVDVDEMVLEDVLDTVLVGTEVEPLPPPK